jgi:hypothetical protein
MGKKTDMSRDNRIHLQESAISYDELIRLDRIHCKQQPIEHLDCTAPNSPRISFLFHQSCMLCCALKTNLKVYNGESCTLKFNLRICCLSPLIIAVGLAPEKDSNKNLMGFEHKDHTHLACIQTFL